MLPFPAIDFRSRFTQRSGAGWYWPVLSGTQSRRRASEPLMEAAERHVSVEAATEQFELALLPVNKSPSAQFTRWTFSPPAGHE
jgi:hypothetical protein